MKKIILINVFKGECGSKTTFHLPPRMPVGPHFPIGIVSIASYLKKNSSDLFIKVFDEQIHVAAAIKKELKKIRPDIVGLSCIFKNYKHALELAQASKKIGAKVVIGGNYATALAKEILINHGPFSKDYCIDAVIRQDGERAFYEYVSDESLDKINNLVYCDRKQIIENPIKLMNLNSLSSLEFNYLNLYEYFKEYQKRFPFSKYKRPFEIYSQKGCRWRDKSNGGCLFCSLMYKKLRLKDPKIVWDEIERLVSDYGVDYIWDVSDSFLSDKNWFKEFYRQAQQRSKKPLFKIQARVDDLIEENVVKMLANLNIAQIFVGFESADNQCLARIKKGTTSRFNEKAVSLLKKYGIPIRAYFVLGLPGETKETLAKSVHLAEKIISTSNNNLIVSPLFVPLPGSLAFQLLKQKTGRKYIGLDVINWDEAVCDWIKYFCRVSYREIKNAQKYLRQFPYDITAYSF